MKEIVSLPNCRHAWIGAKAFFNGLDIDVLMPPPISDKTEKIGEQYSPADVCYPYKLTLGNMVEALEQGATILFMAGGGRGACRLHYYSKLQEITLKKMGYNFKLISTSQPYDVLDNMRQINPHISVTKIIKSFTFVWKKLKTIEKAQDLAWKTRPVEANRGETTKILKEALEEIYKAQTVKAIKSVNKSLAGKFESIKKKNIDSKDILKIGILGEAYCVLEPFSNKHIEEKLGERGVLVCQKSSEAGWVTNSAKLNFSRWWIRETVARKYLKVPGGGEDQQSVGKAIVYAKKGYDGLILIQPRTCLPENVAQMFLPEISRNYNIPYLALSFDENTSETAVDNRIEAFVEMIKMKKNKNKN